VAAQQTQVRKKERKKESKSETDCDVPNISTILKDAELCT
jgi:hypothetical protein